MLPLQQQMQLGSVQQQIPPPPPQQQIPNPNELSLAGVLHFLQTEWRRYEREHNEWEIERAEMRVCFIFVYCQFSTHSRTPLSSYDACPLG
jgi:striatin 1/3/4